ncbi:MAG: ABC transporter substrate-binding protein [Ilumatobacter sp.]|uniref:ABC transporter substrate-binding protein n=1 Tax=Ilumatobacter sp. TaxID=1967498 RepID=UPI0039194046
MNTFPLTRGRLIAIVTAVGLVAASCGTDDTTEPAATEPAATEPGEAADPVVAAGFPFTFTNCDREITLDAPPERVLLMEAAAPSILFAAGAIDRVVARIEDFPPEYYAADELEILAALPALQAQATSTGGVEVSLEAIIDYEPDLVIGYDTATITHESLTAVGIELYVMPPFCDNPPTPSFDSIVDEVAFYGRLFGTSEVADSSAAELAASVAASADQPVAAGRTAAALYVSSDGSAIYAYSALGMVHPQMEALGMTNVFAELSERVPEISIEEIIDRDPEVLVLLYDDTGLSPEEITALVTDLPGAGAIRAVANGDTYPLLFNYAEPPTPLVVQGLEILAEQLAAASTE